MLQANGVATGGLILLVMMVGPFSAAEPQFSCQLFRDASQDVQPKPIDLNATFGDRNKLSLKTGEGVVFVPRMTKNFVGEYFHYTGDVFLIYLSGQSPRLSSLRA